MNIKKVIFLGGAYSQIPIIKEAKQRGWYIVTCDYLPENPGHQLADEYHNISTTNTEKIIELVAKIKPDYLVAYASDPAAPVASFICEKLGLPGNSYDSVKLLSEKDLFRNFLFRNGFNTPKSISVSEDILELEHIKQINLPVIVKPTDASGSKGVSKVDKADDIEAALNYAFTFSRNRRVIIEEFIDNEIADIHGDGFVLDGKLVFSCLGDHLYESKVNPFNPTGTLWPSKQPSHLVNRISQEVEDIIQLSGFRNGPINIEARINHEGMIYIMEIGPRNGGHFVPQAIQYATGFNMVAAFLDLLEGKKIKINNYEIRPIAYCALFTDKDGILSSIKIEENFKPFIKEYHQYIQLGCPVKSFKGANAVIGILLLTFSTQVEMEFYTTHINQFVEIVVN